MNATVAMRLTKCWLYLAEQRWLLELDPGDTPPRMTNQQISPSVVARVCSALSATANTKHCIQQIKLSNNVAAGGEGASKSEDAAPALSTCWLCCSQHFTAAGLTQLIILLCPFMWSSQHTGHPGHRYGMRTWTFYLVSSKVSDETVKILMENKVSKTLILLYQQTHRYLFSLWLFFMLCCAVYRYCRV